MNPGMSEFNHLNKSFEHLNDRLGYLVRKLSTERLSEARIDTIRREMAHISFELDMRERESLGEMAEFEDALYEDE